MFFSPKLKVLHISKYDFMIYTNTLKVWGKNLPFHDIKDPRDNKYD